MIDKRNPWGKRLLKLLIFFVILFVIACVCSLLVWREWGTSDVYTASNIKKLSEKKEARIEKRLYIEIPKSARDIFFYETGGKDLLVYYSMVLPPEEISKFAEEFVGVPLSKFIKEEEAVKLKVPGLTIFRGPPEKWRKTCWNIVDIYQRCVFFGTDKQSPGRERSMIVDPETNRVYLYIY